MMHGDIIIEGEPGKRSTFTIRLPRIVDAPKDMVAASPTHSGELPSMIPTGQSPMR
jgi:hypothetical protein